MAKCWFCKKKAKRYCAPIENLLCPACCGENRLKKIDCIEDCRYLEGVAFQKKRDEEKEFSKLFDNQSPEGHQIDDLTQELLTLYANNIKMWEFNMERNKIGQVFLRLMISIKAMSGGRFGEFGYLNYLKNNFGNINPKKQVIAEDKFGNKILQQL